MKNWTVCFILLAAILAMGVEPRLALARRHRRCCCAENQSAQKPATAEPSAVVNRPPAQPDRTKAAAALAPELPAPFVLTPRQQALVDATLKEWEQQSVEVNSFRCTFRRWNYVPGLLPAPFRNEAVTESTGELACAGQDKWLYKITEVRRFNAKTGKHEATSSELGEFWLRAGSLVKEYREKEKRIVEFHIPVGVTRAISPSFFLFAELTTLFNDGPLPLMYGIQAEAIKQRYYVRVVTPDQLVNKAEKDVLIDAYPKFKRDAVCYQRIILLVKKRTFEPLALRTYDPAGGFCSYQFGNRAINESFESMCSILVPTPLGTWKKIVEP